MTEFIWLDSAVALAVHDRSLALHGGAQGIRDRGLLESALVRPMNQASYGEHLDRFDLAAGYTFGIVKNHPFVDGNKRTGFVLGVLFLELNAVRFGADEAEAANAVLGLAAGEVDEASYAAFLRANSTRAEDPVSG